MIPMPEPSIDTIYDEMLSELCERQLEVVLSDAPEPAFLGQMIRVAVNKNPHWYMMMCERYSTSRRRKNLHFDTRVKRHDIMRILTALRDGKSPKGMYADELRNEAQRRLSDLF